MLGSMKFKNFIYPQIFDQQSLKSYAESHNIKILELNTVLTKVHTIHFVLNVKQDTLSS